jgi:hypothetical protein
VTDRANSGEGYEIGYGKPPLRTRFRKGQSGNPKGRPKGSLNTATMLERILREIVVINEGGRRKKITKLEAALKQLVNKAASGDLAAIKLLATLANTAQGQVQGSLSSETATNDADQKVIASILKRLQEQPKVGGDGEPV